MGEPVVGSARIETPRCGGAGLLSSDMRVKERERPECSRETSEGPHEDISIRDVTCYDVTNRN